jgi:drug/metabolite transporter (DMT)-like permease
VVYSALVGTVLVSAAVPFALEAAPISWRDGGLLLLSGFLAGLGHGLFIAAFARAPAALLAPFTYLQIAWAVLYGILVFGQHPDGWSAVGLAIIVGSGVLLALWERRFARLS